MYPLHVILYEAGGSRENGSCWRTSGEPRKVAGHGSYVDLEIPVNLSIKRRIELEFRTPDVKNIA